MAFRRFQDPDGHSWEVRVRSREEWAFGPVGDNPHRPRTAPAPSYETDPFELSKEELQRLLDQSDPGSSRKPKSPFRTEAGVRVSWRVAAAAVE
jgi:hypothetical protein